MVGEPYWLAEPASPPVSSPPGRFATREEAMDWLTSYYPEPSHCSPVNYFGPVVKYLWNIDASSETLSFPRRSPDGATCTVDGNSSAKVIRKRDFYCPSGYQFISPANYGFHYTVDQSDSPRPQNSQNGYACVKIVPPKTPPCCAGNPIETVGGAKTQREPDFVSPDGKLTLVRHYRSDNLDGAALLGNGWSIETLHRLDVTAVADGAVVLQLGSGEAKYFLSTDGVTWQADRFESDRLSPTGLANGVPTGWLHYAHRQQQLNRFDGTGRLIETVGTNGSKLTFLYQVDGKPQAIVDQSGRQVSFIYNPDGLMQSAQTPDGLVTYSYSTIENFSTPIEGKNLLSAARPDGTAVNYVYGEAAHIAGTGSDVTIGRNLLTGRVDEKGVRIGTYKYLYSVDTYTQTSVPKATSTEGAGGVNKYTFDRQQAYGYVDVTDPRGAVSRNTSQLVTTATQFQDLVGIVGVSQPAGSGYAAGARATAYDQETGNLQSRDTFSGVRSCFAYEASRNLEIVRVEGLPPGQSCDQVTPTASALPPGGIKTSIQWHPDWWLQTRVAAPGKLTTIVYNGQPDPFAGGATASCAPSSALLPDGKPIAVVCKQVDQSTTDVDGRLGFAAAIDASVAARVRSSTYDSAGRLLTSTDPRGKVTTYAYFADNTVDHRQGDLASVRNAANHTTAYTRYDSAGRVLQSSDPNGVVSTYTFDLRGRLKTMSVAGETTTYGYDLAGNNTSITLPDGTTVNSEFDDAHRLTKVTDAAGNSVTYTLDNAGNRVGETWNDGGGGLARSITRVFDAMSRLQSITGANQ